jgi:hypothetical protein
MTDCEKWISTRFERNFRPHRCVIEEKQLSREVLESSDCMLWTLGQEERWQREKKEKYSA